MSSLRPRWAPAPRRWPRATARRPAPRIVGSWCGDALHLWGWDGRHTALPGAVYAALRGPEWDGAPNPAATGHLSSIEITLPDGTAIRPASIRVPAARAARWLHTLPDGAPLTPSVAWLAAVARLAVDTVRAGLVAPALRTDGDRAIARWVPVADAVVTDTLDALAAAMPPICTPGPDDAPSAADIHATMVDALARTRLAEADWRPPLPSSRDPATITARAVLRALAAPDPAVAGSGLAYPEELAALGARFERHARRLAGEPVVLPRARLVVPDDPYDDWFVQLELVDEVDLGRWCTAEDVWDRSPLAVEVAGGEEHLPRLAEAVSALAVTLAESVDLAADLAHEHEPVGLELTVEEAETFLEQAPAALAARGVELVGPERLVRAGITVRGHATPRDPSDHAGRFGRDAVVTWTLVVADGDEATAISEAELERAARAGATLLHSGRRWVRIDPAALRRARKRLEEHVRDHSVVDAVTLLRLAGEGDVRPATTAPSAADVRPWTEALLAGLPDEQLREEREPGGFAGELRPYQRRGLAWLRFLDRLGLGGCLADDMGLGKTATTLAHLLGKPGPHLVVCPLSVVHNWQAEARRFTPSLRVVVHHGAERAGEELAGADLVITTYGLLHRDLEHLGAITWSTVVADEAQHVKNPATHAAKALRAVRAGQKLALTGTPVENRLGDLWAILDMVNPGMLGSRERFRHRFAKPIERDGDEEAAARLRRITQPFVLRRTKADRSLVPDLPDKIEQIAYAALTREQAVLYQHVVDQLLADAASTSGMKRRGLVLAALTRLKQICNHPVQALGDGSRLAGRSGKLVRFDELVDELLDVGERALVFTQFREMGELLVRHLAERLELRVPFLHGGVPKARRDAMVAQFQEGQGGPLLLVSLKAGGTGLNLTAASQVIHYDRWWNPAVEDQATDRAWRIGQGRTVHVHKLVCEGTVEERIAELIDQKRALADAVVGTGEAWLSELSTEELRELVRLEAPVGGRP